MPDQDRLAAEKARDALAAELAAVTKERDGALAHIRESAADRQRSHVAFDAEFARVIAERDALAARVERVREAVASLALPWTRKDATSAYIRDAKRETVCVSATPQKVLALANAVDTALRPGAGVIVSNESMYPTATVTGTSADAYPHRGIERYESFAKPTGEAHERDGLLLALDLYRALVGAIRAGNADVLTHNLQTELNCAGRHCERFDAIAAKTFVLDMARRLSRHAVASAHALRPDPDGGKGSCACPKCAAIQPVVDAFARAMMGKLHKNHHKGDRAQWRDDMPSDLITRAQEELDELRAEVGKGGWGIGRSMILAEAADVANMAMMTADSCGAIETEPPCTAPPPRQSQDESRGCVESGGIDGTALSAIPRSTPFDASAETVARSGSKPMNGGMPDPAKASEAPRAHPLDAEHAAARALVDAMEDPQRTPLTIAMAAVNAYREWEPAKANEAGEKRGRWCTWTRRVWACDGECEIGAHGADTDRCPDCGTVRPGTERT